MSESNIKSTKPTLDYATQRSPSRFEVWLMRPLDWWVIAILLTLISAPFLWMSTRVKFLWGYPPVSLTIVGCVLIDLTLLLFIFARFSLRASTFHHFRIRPKSEAWRCAILFFIPTIIAILVSTSLMTTLWFRIWSNEFDHVRKTLGPSIPPGGSVIYSKGRIGPFRIDRIARSNQADVLGFHNGGAGFVWSETGDLDDPMFHPADYSGRINDHWFWVAPD